MEKKTKAQIAADKLYPAPDRSNYHTDTEYELVSLRYEINKLIFLDGYNAATLRWSDEDMIEFAKYACCLDTNDPVPVIFKEWLTNYKKED